MLPTPSLPHLRSCPHRYQIGQIIVRDCQIIVTQISLGQDMLLWDASIPGTKVSGGVEFTLGAYFRHCCHLCALVKDI